MTLKKEAEEYSLKVDYSWSGITQASAEGFIAGANSNYAKQQVIKGKIEVLKSVYVNGNAHQLHLLMKSKMDELLKQLETPKI